MTPQTSVVALSGRTAAGKSTAADFLVKCGWTAVRYRDVVADLSTGGTERQELLIAGEALHRRGAQMMINEELLRRMRRPGLYVVDGVRFETDKRALEAGFRDRLVHVHLEAPAGARLLRYLERGGSRSEFETVESSVIESQADRVAQMAKTVITTTGAPREWLVTLAREIQAHLGVPVQ
jgi:dephospho-CoA kinase